MKLFAKFISYFFGPFWLPTILYIVLYQEQKETLFPIFLIFIILPLFLYSIYRIITNTKEKLDFSIRQNRIVPLLLLSFSMIGFALYCQYIGIAILQYKILLLVCIIFINLIITLFWKISFHMAINTIGFILLSQIISQSSIAAILIIPLVAWSRLVQKKHTIAQLIAGVVVNAGLYTYLQAILFK